MAQRVLLRQGDGLRLCTRLRIGISKHKHIHVYFLCAIHSVVFLEHRRKDLVPIPKRPTKNLMREMVNEKNIFVTPCDR